MHGHKIFLPEQPDGWSRMHHDIDIHDTTRIFGKIQPQGKSEKWINIHMGN